MEFRVGLEGWEARHTKAGIMLTMDSEEAAEEWRLQRLKDRLKEQMSKIIGTPTNGPHSRPVVPLIVNLFQPAVDHDDLQASKHFSGTDNDSQIAGEAQFIQPPRKPLS